MAEQIPSKINLEIVTPDRLYFAGEVDEVSVPGIEGYMGILPGHAPLLSELKIGVITFREGSKTTRIVCNWGFVEVLTDRVSVLAETAQASEEVDVEQARNDRQSAEAVLRSKSADTDFEKALRDWERASAQLEAAES